MHAGTKLVQWSDEFVVTLYQILNLVTIQNAHQFLMHSFGHSKGVIATKIILGCSHM
jgi:hypothetical protein